ncbi:cell division control protein 45 homolog [Lingula anatina]|uniref:Cell division control protein 45 homolog n=1 Tax=Lingula anatina TaxID=7574 RepID=A0A1S3HD16_LINAN|nr:cell division control protein 45 homolog [Lingula anatina]|eukprot:XP_013383421.1 cell division control protein 45 homolog [Lingula anatina]
MVFVKDLRKEFYEKIQHQRVLVLVSFDVDALCACKILQYLFQCDHVLYTIVPVSGKQELENAYVENSEGIKHVVMIGCGGNIDVVETLQPENGTVFYISDSHRPIDVTNVFNQVQVKLLMNQADDDLHDIPDFDEVFREDESGDEDSGNESDTSEPSGKRRRFDEAALEKRRERRLWEEKKKQILFEYTQFSKYGTSVSKTMFELAWKMSKDTNDLVWLACVGVTDQYAHGKIDREKYIEMVSDLQMHVSRHNHSLLKPLGGNYHLAALDKDKSASDTFLDALDALNRSNVQYMEKGLNLAKKQITAIVKQVQSFLDMNQVISAGPFLYAFIQEGTPDAKFFSKPICLQTLARFTLEAYCAVSKSRKAKTLPLILGAPLDVASGTMLIVGIPPFSSKDVGKNFFGKAFEQAAVGTNARTLQDSFDEPVMQMKTEDKSKFFDALISILQ